MSGNGLSFELQKLRGKRVVVTGATGFIGGRVVQMLLQEPDIQVVAMMNSYHRAINLVRQQVTLAKADITNYNQVLKAVEGADVVIHCAYVSRGTFDEQAANTILGSENVFKASLAAQVKHVVYLSTMSVYGIETSGKLDENCPNKKSNFFYSDAKITCEELAFKYFKEHKLPIVVIQPTIVYGPGSNSWVISPLLTMREAFKVLPDNGDGICNPVYVDDVAQACVLAATGDKGVGERYLISGAEHLTWKEYYANFERMLGEPGVKLQPLETIKANIAASNNRPSAFAVIWEQLKKERTRNFLRQFALFSALFSVGRKMLPGSVMASIRAANQQSESTKPKATDVTTPVKPLRYDPLFVYDILKAKPVASIEKARKELGYEPKYDIKKGMALTEKWAAWAGYLPSKD